MIDLEAKSPFTAQSTADFLAALASNKPAPAGGAASALAGAMAAALVVMVARLMLGRPQHAACHEEMREWHSRAEALQNRLLALADADTCAVLRLMESYSLPKDTEEERATRFGATQNALRDAVQVPLETAAACTELVALAARAAEWDNRNTASDAAVAAMLAHAGLQAAVLNMRTNLQSLHDETLSSEVEAQVSHLSAAAETALARALTAAEPGR